MTEKEQIRVVVSGPRGRMGSETIRMIAQSP
ncbi:MAG: hypothetical protein K0Q56_2602, partial [Sporolactobacillus laevolacticus]|nr:hypothetical protein [Sporolactobacillus laevolacticus]